jgi:spermidine synthase
MARPWQTIESVDTDEGILELRKRGDKDYLITIAGRVLMNSTANRSEILLSQIACNSLNNKENTRVLIGGLGMGYTLKTALDNLPDDARVVVAELNPVVLKWCRGSIAHLTDSAVNDPRVTVKISDVAAIIQKADNEFNAIILDLYEGPFEAAKERGGHLYGADALRSSSLALVPGGVFAVWSEDPDKAFEKRLVQAGFTFKSHRPRRGNRHIVYIARKAKHK